MKKPCLTKVFTTTFENGVLQLCLFMDQNFSIVATQCIYQLKNSYFVLGNTDVFRRTFLYWKVFFLVSFRQMDSSMLAGANLLIAVGAIIMILGFLGCCGAVKENRCMLMLVGKKNICLPLTSHSYIWWIESLQVVSNEDGNLLI